MKSYVNRKQETGPLVLFDVFQQRRASIHHGLERVLAAGGDAFIRVQQHRQLPVRLVHLLPGNEQVGTKVTQRNEQVGTKVTEKRMASVETH